jgi:cell pole-organizing protein PopZ
VILAYFDLDAAMGSASLKVNEPSMEEILASIRRIISDDETLRPSEPDEPVSSPLKNVLDIAELHVSPLIASSPNESVLGPWSRGEAVLDDWHSEDEVGDGLNTRHEPEEPAPALAQVAVPKSPPTAAASVAAIEPATDDLLLSNETNASVSGAFDRLSASLKPSQPQTVEDLMKEMLRPMLKAWLDDKLPSLVERLVRDEIERVTRCRG